MKKINFNNLKNVRTPDEWIETAINIPQKKKAVPFYLKPYFLATAASVVLCCALSLLIFMGTGKNTSVLPVSKATEPTASYNQPTNPDGTPNNQQEPYTQLVTNSSGEVIDVIIKPNVQPVTEPKESDVPQPANTTNPSGTNATQGENPSGAFATSTVGYPTPPVTDTPDKTEKPSTKPNQHHTTVPPATKPSIKPTELSTAVPQWSEPATTQSIDDDGFKHSIIFVPSYNSEFDLNGKVYCHIEEPGFGSLTDINSPKEKCSKTYYKNRVCASYNPFNRLGVIYSNQYYNVTFYDSKGHSIRTRCYLGKSDCFVYE